MAAPAAILNILVNANTSAATASLAKTNAQLKGVEAQAAATSGAMGGKFAKAAKVGTAAVVVGAVLAGKALYDMGKEFDDAEDKIRVGTGKTGKALKQLEADFRGVYKNTPAGMNDVAEAIVGVNQRLGLTGKALRRESRQFVELSRITGTDLQGNIKSVSRAFEDWDVAVKNQASTMDMFFRASQKSGASVEDITTLLVKFGSPLRQLGFGIDEATAMFAQFEKAGVNIQTMVPGLKLALGNFLEAGKDPHKALMQTFKEMEKGTISTTEILKIFQKRAGADMIEAVGQGRFHLHAFMKEIEGGDTINKAAKETNDFGENMSIVWHKIQVALRPVAADVFDFFTKLSEKLAAVNFTKLIQDAGKVFQDIKHGVAGAVDSLKTFWKESGVTRAVVIEAWRIIRDVVTETIRAIIMVVQGWFKMLKGIIQVISGILTGDFGRAWKGVKNIFSGGVQATIGVLKGITAPIRRILATVGGMMADIFRGIWDGITGIFEGGVNKVIDFLNLLIDAINLIPGISDIGHIGTIGGGGGEASTGKPGGKNGGGNLGKTRSGAGHARGGPIFGGRPSGDSIPAMLERGEYVLNRKAVRAMGKRQLDAINFGMAPRFALGGLSDLAGKAVGAASSVVNKGAGYFLDKLPKPNLPAPFAGIGPYVIGQVTDFIKNGFKSKKLGKFISGPGGYSGPPANMKQLGNNSYVDSHTLAVTALLDKMFGLEMSSGYRSPAHNAEIGGAPGSLHTHGSPSNPGATDSVGSMSKMQAYIAFARSHVAGLQEAMVDNYAGSGYNAHIGFFKKGGMAGWVHGSKTLNADQLASLAHYAGMANPALMGQIAMGESSGNPHAIGHDPGGTEGLGLWQITTGYNDALIAKYGGRSAMFDPLTNARAAAELLASSGTGAWYAPPTGPKGTVSPLGGGGGGRRKAAAAVKKVMGLGKGRSLARHANIRQHNKAVHRNKQGIGRGVIPGVHGGGAEVAGEGATGEGEETDAQRESREATEALTAALEAHAAEEKAMREELKRQTDFAEAASSADSATYLRAIADMISGNLGPKAFHSAQTAGSGSVGTF